MNSRATTVNRLRGCRHAVVVGMLFGVVSLPVHAGAFDVDPPQSATQRELKLEFETNRGAPVRESTLPQLEYTSPLTSRVDISAALRYVLLQSPDVAPHYSLAGYELKSVWDIRNWDNVSVGLENTLKFSLNNAPRGSGEPAEYEPSLLLAYDVPRWEFIGDLGLTHTFGPGSDSSWVGFRVMHSHDPSFVYGAELIATTRNAPFHLAGVLLRVGFEYKIERGFEIEATVAGSVRAAHRVPMEETYLVELKKTL